MDRDHRRRDRSSHTPRFCGGLFDHTQPEAEAGRPLQAGNSRANPEKRYQASFHNSTTPAGKTNLKSKLVTVTSGNFVTKQLTANVMILFRQTYSHCQREDF